MHEVTVELKESFRPLAGLSCINPAKIPRYPCTTHRFRPLAGLSCINRTLCAWVCGSVAPISFRPLAGLSCINLARAVRPIRSRRITFPSPRGVELHKPPREPWRNYTPPPRSFRPLAGLSCINLTYTEALYLLKRLSFRPLAGLSCINLASNCGLWVAGYPRVSVPSRG